MATHSSILGWKIPRTAEPGRRYSPGLQRVRHDWVHASNTRKKKIVNYQQYFCEPQFISFQFSRSVMSNSLWPHESQHARTPCPSPTPGVQSDSCPLSRWCHPAISSSVIPFSSCPQFLPASESFPMSQPFAWGSQSTGVSALASFLPKKSQGWSPSEDIYYYSRIWNKPDKYNRPYLSP